MNRELIIQPEAEEDIAEAFGWYEARLSGLGSEFLLVLDAVFNSILRDPNIYPQVHKQVRRALARRFPFAVFFLVEKTRVVVLSIFHVKRNPRIWKKRTSNKALQPIADKTGSG
jgi:toxin ParE1/3/4